MSKTDKKLEKNKIGILRCEYKLGFHLRLRKQFIRSKTVLLKSTYHIYF